MDKYNPTSIPSVLLSFLSAGIICFADYISRKLQLKGHINQNTNVDAESIRNYLNPNRKNHWTVKIANAFICCFVLLLIILVPAVKYIGAKIDQQLKKEQTVVMIISKSNNVFEV